MIGKIFRRIVFILFVAIVGFIVFYLMLQYSVEGEKNLPFSISKILVVSTVDGKPNEDNENIWNINIEQVNDVFIYLEKNVEDNQTINEIKLENFQIIKKPSKGNIKLYKPTGDITNLYIYSKENFLETGLTYIGGKVDEMKALQIANNGGMLGFRLGITDLGTFLSNEEEEVSYDGKLLSGLNVSQEEIDFSISFDIIITTSENINFKGTITLDLPVDNLIEEGTSNKEILDTQNIVFKRV